MPGRKKVLFVCTGNSARSQMAEGFLRAIGGDALEAASGGLAPGGIHPLTPKVMAERNIDIAMQTSKEFRIADAAAADLVITLCDNARGACPMLPPGVESRHWSLEDPAAAPPDEAIEVFRRVRDEIEKRVAGLVGELHAGAADTSGGSSWWSSS